MGALRNTLRRVVADGRPLVLGLHLAGDAACTTNPTLGRGISFAAAGVSRLVEVVDEAPDDAVAQALLLDDHLTREIEPHFVENALFDRARAATLRADLAGQPPPSPPPAPPSTDGTVRPDELLRASFADPVAYRANMRYQQLLEGASILSDPVVVERVRATLTPDLRMPAPAAPTRAELAELLG
jgi:flavin-dependent dehydrogenase